jgi:hypothetical protein
VTSVPLARQATSAKTESSIQVGEPAELQWAFQLNMGVQPAALACSAKTNKPKLDYHCRGSSESAARLAEPRRMMKKNLSGSVAG